MNVLHRIRDLIRPDLGADTAVNPAQQLTIDLSIAAVGIAFFGACIAARGDLGWHVLSGVKLAGAFLAAFLLSLAPLFAQKRFFSVKTPFALLVSSFARHLALGGIFAAASAGCFLLLRRQEPNFDGWLAIGFVIAIFIGVALVRPGGRVTPFPVFPRAAAVALFLGLLAQSAWAFRPYMDPAGPTLFESHAEWLGAHERALLERTIVRLGGSEAGASP